MFGSQRASTPCVSLMMSVRCESKLFRLENTPSKHMSNLVWINNNEIATATFVAFHNVSPFSVLNHRYHHDCGIWVYNILTNTWRIHIKYPNNITIDIAWNHNLPWFLDISIH